MGGQRVGRRRPPDGAALRPVDRSPACVVQELNVAILKATTGQFHVAPKEKHVRSERASLPAPAKGVEPSSAEGVGSHAASAWCHPPACLA